MTELLKNRFSTQKISLDDHQDRIAQHGAHLGLAQSDKMTATPGASLGIKKWATMAFASVALAAGLGQTPQAHAQTASYEPTPQAAQIERTNARHAILDAYNDMNQTLGWKTTLDGGVAQHMPISMLEKNQQFQLSETTLTGKLSQAVSRAQALLGPQAYPDEREAVSKFREAVVNAVPDAVGRLHLDQAFTKEAHLHDSRMTIRNTLDDLLASEKPSPEMVNALTDSVRAHSDKLNEVANHYLDASKSLKNSDHRSSLNEGLLIGTTELAQEAQQRASLAKNALNEIKSHTAHMQNPEAALEKVRLAALSAVENDLGQRLPNKHEFLLAARDASGNVLPGEIDLDAAPSEVGSKDNDVQTYSRQRG